MHSLNKHTILGYVGADPETRYTQSGAAVTNFSVATTEKWRDKESGETQERTEWHRCVSFGRGAEILAEYVRKGDRIYIEGRIQTQKWQDRDGNDRYTTQTVILDFLMLGNRSTQDQQPQGNQQRNGGQQRPPQQQSMETDPFVDDDIPF